MNRGKRQTNHLGIWQGMPYRCSVLRPIELGEQGTRLAGTRYQRVLSCRSGQEQQVNQRL